ncbi:delta-1-pyrroline-5-carboxylate synthase-like isoform X2 [Oppia nitens]|uniref:delta-1-pyrroline-5-carboxylate synthase-like isoform X2 n=1 Tax=Oppia nitens TaxID=1686743 RepID=UPI0023DAE573|nr:delta-1-pyrroline-5-carboxylate synthase-like isoform X2 [Oppia nitens]
MSNLLYGLSNNATKGLVIRFNNTRARLLYCSSIVSSKQQQQCVRGIHNGKRGLRALQDHLHREIDSKPFDESAHRNVLRRAFETRDDLKNAQRIVVKLGSAVITREDECGLALGRLASIVEQVSQLHNEGKDVLMVTSGAVAFGKQRLGAEMRMSMSMRETLSPKELFKLANPEPRAAAAVGQSGLMALYDAMFTQYGVHIAQVLVTKPDFYNPISRHNLRSTVLELLNLNIIPIINTNDAVVSPAMADSDLAGVISIQDNDSLAAHLAVEANADSLILMSDVNGIYTLPPDQEGARLLHTFVSSNQESITFGNKSRVGLGGMESKVKSATWALERGVSVIICNGMEDQAITRIMSGKRVGTFFTQYQEKVVSVQTLAANARKGSRVLQALTPAERSDVIVRLANLLQTKKDEIMLANAQDLRAAEASGLSKHMISRLTLTPEKLKDLSEGLLQIADQSHDALGQCLRHTLIADGIHLKQVTVPLGVLLVIFESRPDCLPQIAALSIATGNALLAKGGKEATHTNTYLYNLIKEALSNYESAENAIGLVSNREDVSELLQFDNYIDLVIPRGSNELVRSIQAQSKSIPVLGHSEGICHVYVDINADRSKALKIVLDSKCNYPSACNAMETLLLHKSLLDTDFFAQLCNELKENGVDIYAGPRLSKKLTFGPQPAKSLRTEYGSLACTIEIVDDVNDAIEHINTYGSGHTDTIVTEDNISSHYFQKTVDSACVFHNISTRFADGYRFGLGAEVGISTGRIHARGPVGMQGLLTTKWVINGSGNTVSEFSSGDNHYKHEALQLENFE